ncbi:acyl-CoA dehydrogenase [Burkholderia thailandensis]|nr:acyl-CoA dehydrogenase [Burkholderia thailandensis]
MNAITRPAGSHTARPVSSDAAALDATPARSPLAQRTRAPDDPRAGNTARVADYSLNDTPPPRRGGP